MKTGINEEGFMEDLEAALLKNMKPNNVFQIMKMANCLEKTSIKDKCLKDLASTRFRECVTQQDSLMKLDEKDLIEILNYHAQMKQKSTQSEKYLALKDLKAIITNYCDENFDETMRPEKFQNFMDKFVNIKEQEDLDISKDYDNTNEDYHASNIENNLIKKLEMCEFSG